MTEEASKVTIKPVIQAPIWKHLLWLGVALVALWALSKIPSTLIVFSLAWLIAYLLNPVVDALSGKKIGPIKACSRGQAVGIVASLLVGAMIAAGAMMLPQISDQIERLISLQEKLGDPSQLPMVLRQKAEPFLARVPEQYRAEVMAKASNFIQESASKVGLWASQIVKSIGAFIGQLFSAIFLVCSAFLVSLYMLLNWHNLMGSFLDKLPRQYQREVVSLSVKLNEIFGGYLKATILTAIACMIATYISLMLLCFATGHQFPYKGLVAFVAGLSYPIPVIGIIATSILGGVLGFVAENNVGFGIAVLIVINVVNIIIDRTVQPRLMSDAIGVSELFVMFAAFAGGEVAGVWGMLLGIPVAAMGKTLFEWFHLNFLLVDDDHPTPGPAPHPSPSLVEPPPAGVAAPSPQPVVVVERPEGEKTKAVQIEAVSEVSKTVPLSPSELPPGVEKSMGAEPPPAVVLEQPAPAPPPGPAIPRPEETATDLAKKKKKSK